MSRYAPLPSKLANMLRTIEPSCAGEFRFFPCRVTLTDGATNDRVYIEPEDVYLKYWGVYPEDDRAKSSVSISNVELIEDSPVRLPAKFATAAYSGGEMGMGMMFFTVIFSDGQQQVYSAGNAIDFIPYPPGKGPQDVVDVVRGGNRIDPSIRHGLPYSWCLYSGVAFPAPPDLLSGPS